MTPNKPKHINWPTTLFMILTPIVAIAGLIWWLVSGQFHIQTVILAIVYLAIAGLGITAGYHRLFSHRTYEAAWPVRLAYLLAGAATFEGSAMEWSLDHRNHHRFIDKDKDPYSVKDGFWHAHILWLFSERERDFNPSVAPDLWRDKLVVWQHKFFLPIAIGMSFFFPMLIASLWGDAWGGFFIAGFLRLVLNDHTTFCINSVCHVFGKQTYSDKHSARDNGITALLTYGEGYHNFHHEFASDYRNGIRFYQYDPTKWLIYGLFRVGLASNLHRVNPEQIIIKKMAMQEKHLAEKLAAQSPAIAAFASRVITDTKEQFHIATARLVELRHQYQTLKKEKNDEMQHQVLELKHKLQDAQRDFQRSVALWKAMNNGLMKLVSP
jgi:stearoyl-CoA desaturase (delta-9 desaturase)